MCHNVLRLLPKWQSCTIFRKLNALAQYERWFCSAPHQLPCQLTYVNQLHHKLAYHTKHTKQIIVITHSLGIHFTFLFARLQSQPHTTFHPFPSTSHPVVSASTYQHHPAQTPPQRRIAVRKNSANFRDLDVKLSYRRGWDGRGWMVDGLIGSRRP